MTKNTIAHIYPEAYKRMTVPFLRSLSYESKFGNSEQIAQNEAYTSYLTSYNSDNLKINALLTKPTSTMPKSGWPAIVFVHGYIPPQQYVITEKYVAYVDSLARNGFVVLKIDLRGHGNSEGEAGGGYFGSDYVIDTLNAYYALGKLDFVNKNKIGMWGHSMAGNILLRSAVVKKDIPALVIWAGAVYSYEDLLHYKLNDTTYRPPSEVSKRLSMRQTLFSEVGSPSAKSPFWREVAPTNYLSDLSGAIQIQHAIDDETVNVGYSRDLVDLLNKAGVRHEYFEYQNGGHNIASPSFELAIKRTIEFYKHYLN